MSLPIPTATEVAYASGELASSRTRRLHGSSTDHPSPTPDGFIGGDLRAGGPDLRESPCNSNHRIPPDHPDHEQLTGDGAYKLIKQAYGICEEEGLEYSGVYFCFRRSIYDTEDDEHGRGPAMTLLVDIRRGTGTHRGWVGVARKLHDLLLGEGVHGVSVEIADPRFEDNLSLYGCYPTDIICPVWRDLVPEIIAQVDTTGINTIGCFRIGLKNTARSDCAPTVLLGVDYRVQRDWNRVRETVVHVLDRYNLSSVAVLIRKDSGKPSLSAAGFRNLERTSLGPDECRPDPSLGSSLSAHGVDTQDTMGVFTLGGWVELRNPETGEWVPLALTCSHCCFPREEGLSAADQEVLWTWKQEGVRIGDPNAARLLSMDSPCYRDIKAGVDAKESAMARSKADKVYQRVEAARAQGEFVLPGDKAKWKTASRILEALEKDRDSMKSFVQNGQHVLGNVFAASGIREARSTDDANRLSVRDWALIQPKSGRSAGDNAIRPLLSDIPLIQHLGEFQTELPQKDEEVHKIGRVSGLTHGWYSALQSCLLNNETKDGHTVARQTWEHVVTKPSGAFLELGDSGSLLFNASGDVLGILFGASEQGDIAYFTPTQDLLQDIRSVTGALEIRMKQE